MAMALSIYSNLPVAFLLERLVLLGTYRFVCLTTRAVRSFEKKKSGVLRSSPSQSVPVLTQLLANSPPGTEWHPKKNWSTPCCQIVHTPESRSWFYCPEEGEK